MSKRIIPGRKDYEKWLKSGEARHLFQKLFDEVKGVCMCCGNKMEIDKTSATNATFDHMIPLTMIKKHTLDNLRVICKTCNHRKSDYVGLNQKDKDYILKKTGFFN